jgi:hypothetical protein
MATALVYTGKKAIHTAGVDVGPNFIHFDLDGDPVEVDDGLADDLLRDHPLSFKKYVVKVAPKADPIVKGEK